MVPVDAQLDMVDLPQGSTDDSFTISLRQAGGAHSHHSSSKLNHVDAHDFRACVVFADKRPTYGLSAWRYEPQVNWGTLQSSAGKEVIPSEQGRYHDKYEAFALALDDSTPPPATVAHGPVVLAVLDAAWFSAERGVLVAL